MFVTSVSEVPSLNLSRDADSPDCALEVFFSSSRQRLKRNFKLVQRSFAPNPFYFVIKQSKYHLMLYSFSYGKRRYIRVYDMHLL